MTPKKPIISSLS